MYATKALSVDEPLQIGSLLYLMEKGLRFNRNFDSSSLVDGMCNRDILIEYDIRTKVFSSMIVTKLWEENQDCREILFFSIRRDHLSKGAGKRLLRNLISICIFNACGQLRFDGRSEGIDKSIRILIESVGFLPQSRDRRLYTRQL